MRVQIQIVAFVVLAGLDVNARMPASIPQSRPAFLAGQASAAHKSPRPGAWLQKNHNLPPEAQQKSLEDDPDFKNLNPQQQQRLRNRLQTFNNLPPAQRERTIQRLQTLESLPPEKRQQVQSAFKQLSQVPDNRRPLVRRAVKSLTDMPPEQRDKVLQSDRFRQTFSDSERGTISSLVSAQTVLEQSKTASAHP